MASANDFILITPLILLAVWGFLLPVLGSNTQRRGLIAAFAFVGLSIAGLFTAAWVWDVPGLAYVREAAEANAGAPILGVLEVNPFVAFFNVTFLLVAGLVVLTSPGYLTTKHQGEYYGLLTMSTLGMFVVAGSRDLITLFVGLELASFCTYVLAGYFKRAPDSSEASVKYFIIGSLASALTLFGISLVYALTGDVTFDALARGLGTVTSAGGQTLADLVVNGSLPLWVFAWGFLLAGFGFKIALVPFHNWAADVYDGAPSTVSAFLAAGSKKMGFAALFKLFLVGLLAIKANWIWAAGLVAIITMTVGNVVALRQDNVKRMLAYSSVAQAGYMLIALPVATQFALAGGLYYILAHAFMKAGAFVVVAAVAAIGVSEILDDWRGLGKRAPYLALAMTVFMISFAGIPPFAGFVGKFILFGSAIQAGGWLVWLAVFGILNSAVSLYYYARVVRVMYVDESPGPVTQAPIATGATVAVTLALLGTVLLGVWPAPFFEFSQSAAAVLLP